MKYADKLRLPAWKEFRQRVLEAKGDICEDCGCRAEPPHIHHAGYVYGREPWEYELHEVKVLCEACHEIVHERRTEFDTLFAAIHWKSLALLLKAISDFASVDPNGNTGLAHHVYVFFKQERRRLSLEGMHRKTIEEWEVLRRQVRNILLSFNVETLDAWLDGLDIFKQLSEGEQLEVAQNLCSYVRSAERWWDQGEASGTDSNDNNSSLISS